MTRLGRRRWLALGGAALCCPEGLAAVPATSAPGNGQEARFSDLPTLIVGGPENSALAPWARMLGSAIGQRMLPTEQPLRIVHIGGADGVTAANQFEARTAPDGATALLISGSTAVAWLMGDPRVQFDAGHWLPLATGLASAVVVATQALTLFAPAGAMGNGPASAPTGRYRLSCSGPLDVAIAASLGLSMLGLETQAATTSDDPVAELRAGRADFALLQGAAVIDRLTFARRTGDIPIFSLGATDEAGQNVRDPLIPDVPSLPELLSNGAPHTLSSLLPAWRAVAATAQIEFALVLPWLTPSGTVALWRKAVSQMALSATPDVQASGPSKLGPKPAMRIHTDPAGNFGMSAMRPDANTLIELRRWAALRNP